MTKNIGYQCLAADSMAPGICRTHRLLNYTKIAAEIDAKKIRESAVADTPPSRAQAQPCYGTSNWHIFIPTKSRMRKIRKATRQTKGSGH